MTITKDHIGGLVFLCFSVAYGYYASQIQLFPGDEYEPFHAKSMPLALAALGVVFSLLQLITASKKDEDKLSLKGYDFGLMGKLLVLMVLFAISLDWMGFLVSTVFFLAGGYWLLGERRPKMLFLASVPFAVGFWYVLTQLLDIYLAPGQVWANVLGS
ncbi:tripartite tricarboxylate transporter TctB family protein [Photobacterium sanctipauli]|uniref:Tripartite tricarboxylate transporter TctB family protein n=1 Tax=Photobacterium sanctipauli TaxID=1342794 RepID=A0A2T3NU74_9GAMM|nr:tripartite tricarboxylate transporter TctB family protein [Photobacterium sanctipauli]PSW19824.1 tripartite tricarboxylate transporter TctB family protein [Photobacterium sanctipauli]